MTKAMKYDNPELPGKSELELALKRNDPHELARMIVALSLDGEGVGAIEVLCHELAKHGHEQVRGNAVLGLGHLSRRFGVLKKESLELIEAALRDDSSYVRGQAWSAAEDAAHFLGVRIRGFKEESNSMDG